MAATGQDPSEIITQKGLSQINNEQEIIIVIDEMLAKNPQAIMDYQRGKNNVFQFLVGQVLAATRGRANPDLVKKIILERLANLTENHKF